MVISPVVSSPEVNTPFVTILSYSTVAEAAVKTGAVSGDTGGFAI